MNNSENIVNERLQGFLSNLKQEVESHLTACDSPGAKMLFLGFLERNMEMMRSTHSGSEILQKLHMPEKRQKYTHWLYPEAGEMIPVGLGWADSPRDDQNSTFYQLLPQFVVEGDVFNREDLHTRKIECNVDFAYFIRNSVAGPIIKVAIICESDEAMDRLQANETDRFLQGKGWIIARFTESEILNNPLSVIDKIETLWDRASVQAARAANDALDAWGE